MIDVELKEMISRCVDGLISVREFEKWLVPRLPALIFHPDSTDSEVVAVIELGLAEMATNIRTEEGFIGLLHATLNEHSIMLGNPSDTRITTRSSNKTITPTFLFVTATSPD